MRTPWTYVGVLPRCIVSFLGRRTGYCSRYRRNPGSEGKSPRDPSRESDLLQGWRVWVLKGRWWRLSQGDTSTVSSGALESAPTTIIHESGQVGNRDWSCSPKEFWNLPVSRRSIKRWPKSVSIRGHSVNIRATRERPETRRGVQGYPYGPGTSRSVISDGFP